MTIESKEKMGLAVVLNKIRYHLLDIESDPLWRKIILNVSDDDLCECVGHRWISICGGPELPGISGGDKTLRAMMKDFEGSIEDDVDICNDAYRVYDLKMNRIYDLIPSWRMKRIPTRRKR